MAFVWGAYMNDGKKRLYLELGRAPIHLSEMVRRQESHARFTDDLREGKLNMLFNPTPRHRPATDLGRILLAGFLAVVVAATTVAQTSRSVPDVTAMSMEDLMNMKVTSVSKRTQKVADAAAAIFVITQEDIRRSGATSIPEALRMAPGLQVARIDENKWAIGSRGFNGRFDNKLLVLIDGRSVYTPLFSGVYWNVQDVMLEDVDRIEVIRGPGATLWGANAVDGVINVITKKAKSTQSTIVTAGAGTEERAAGGARYGSKLGDNTYYRAYAKYFDWGPSAYPSGMTAHDGWDALRGGFRADWTPTGANSLTLQGDIYRSRFDETLTVASLSPPYSNTFPNDGKYSGGNLLGRWNHTSETSSTSTSSMPFTPGIHNNSYGALVIARSVTRTTPALRFPCSLIKSLSISSAHSFRMKSAWLTIGCRSRWGPNSSATGSPGLKLSLTQDCSGPSHQINRSGLQFHALSEPRP